MKRKILFVRTMPYYQNPQSYNVQAIGLGKAFVNMGFDYDYVCPKDKEEKTWTFYENNGCKGRCLEISRVRFIRWGIFTKILNRKFLKQYDIIISQEYYQIMTFLLGKMSDKVVMYNGPYYNLFMFPFFSPIYDFFFTKRIDDVVKLKFVKSVLSKDYLENKGYHNVINVGVGLDIFRFKNPNPVSENTKEIVDYMKKNRCILYIGNLMDRKNYPFMLKLYERLLDKYQDLKFVVIGKSKIGPFSKMIGGKDEDYEQKLIPTIPEKVKQGIYRVQRIDNEQLKYIYPLAKAFILPSKKEIFGMVLPEAMYLGAPVVTTKNGGSMTLIGEKGPGIMIDGFSLELWVDAVSKLVDDVEYNEQIKKQAKKLIIEQYTWDAVARKMLNSINKYYIL